MLAGTAGVTAKSKTRNPEKVAPALAKKAPYRFNGVVHTESSRGSGFCAWNRKTYFSAAHVVFDTDSWGQPPLWVKDQNSANLVPSNIIQTRGYYRWIDYADLAVSPGSDSAFRRDVILGYAFQPLIKGTPARINLNGYKDLLKKKRSMITGYPAENAYLEKPIRGYYLHKTGPAVTPYKKDAGKSLSTTLITTGGGNSGGPVWTPGKKNNWLASGILVGGLPSETVVYAFSPDVNSLTRAVSPLLRNKIGQPLVSNGVTGSSLFFPIHETKKIPDGSQKWTSFRFGVNKFDTAAIVTRVSLSVDIRTKHRGDLQIYLEAPGGYQLLLQNQNGAGKNNFILKDAELTRAFTDIEANGFWYLRVRDTIRGDQATFRSAVLEISTDQVPGSDEETGS